MFSSRVGGPAGRRRTPRNWAWVVLTITALVALSAVSAAGATRAPIESPFAGDFTPVKVPYALDNTPTTVVVQMSADPVALAESKSASGFDKNQWNSLRDQLRSQQAPVENQIKSLGGQVLATYQLAYNGIKVQIAGHKMGALAAIPGVVAVRPLQTYMPDNVRGVPLIGAPAAWAGLSGYHGEGIKIADIDTGIDYTHADFGGPGTIAAYQHALGLDTADPSSPLVCMTNALTPCVGPSAPRVKGGIDLVGDNYAAGGTPAQQIPHPDANPLDCNNHGTHTAGTAAGSGVLSNGSTYTGPYDANTITSHSWNVGPGVAPKADIYSVRVFGCTGSTNVVVDAIEWAVANHMDVINMSLGSSFGSPDTPDAVASTNAARDGVIVIASSGNSGGNAYITGSPASSTGAVSVAASDPAESFVGASINLSPGGPVQAINANGYTPLPSGPLNVHVAYAAPGVISQGCSPAADGAPLPLNTVLVVARGNCARVAKAIFGQQAGAVAVVMVNNAAGLPPFEGKITSNPDDGTPYTVTIPFLGVAGAGDPSSSANAALFGAADGHTATISSIDLTNPGFRGLASFSSWGPATGDSSLKPNVTAPGVSIASAGMGTGSEAIIESGTSMAAPHTTGMAALVKQAHPSWGKVKYWEAAIQNTADPAGVTGYATRGAGVGLIQALPAVQTNVVALGSTGNGGENDDDNHEGGRHGGNAQTATLNFGFNEIDKDYSQSATVQLRNFSNSSVTFAVTDALDQGSPHSVSFDRSTITLGPRDQRDVRVRLSVPLSSAGGASTPGTPGAFSDVAGLVTFTPIGGSNNGVTLRVPYYMVPQGVSHVSTRVRLQSSTLTATTSNRSAVAGTADWYALGITDKRDKSLGSNDLRAVGVQSWLPYPGFAFAISTYNRWSNAAENEFDISVDVNNDGTPDYVVVVADLGALTTPSFDGRTAVAVFPLPTGSGNISFLADAPTDSSTLVAPVKFSQLCRAGHPCLNAANPRFTYSVDAIGLQDGTVNSTATSAKFNPFTSAVNTGMFDVLSANGSASEPLSVNATEFLQSPALGWMVVSHENPGGTAEAQLLSLKGDELGNH